MPRPIIGITVDNRDNSRASGTYEVATAYGRAVTRAGGSPILLPHEIECVEHYLAICDGLVLTGGVDPDSEPRGQALPPLARRMDPTRQTFELALLRQADDRPDWPVLGICLGMQLMALLAGGSLDQYLPDTLGHPEIHQDNRRHPIERLVCDSALFDEGVAVEECVVSSHQQAVAHAGRLRIIAKTADGVIEAIDDPSRRFYGGVQWHPERGGEGSLSDGLMGRLVHAARCQTNS